MPNATNEKVFFDCGATGLIIAAPGIKFKHVDLPVEHGKVVMASAKTQIAVAVDLEYHTTTLTALPAVKKPKPGPALTNVAIRIPVGVRLCPIVGLNILFYETFDGYNILPHHQPADDKHKDQKVQEVVLITSHIPPRCDPTKLSARDYVSEKTACKKLTLAEAMERLQSDDPTLDALTAATPSAS